MKIIDLEDKYLQEYFMCLEEWSDEIKEAGNHKQVWFNKMKDRGLGVKLAVNDEGVVGGMIQYIPIEYSNAEGVDLYFINCIWVHGYEEGRGDFQKMGYGKALLQAAEEDVKKRGAKGIVAWGVSLPFWMKASWFKKNGYTRTDKDSIASLLWKPFTDDAVPPKWIKEKKQPQPIPGKVLITSFLNGWCPAQNLIRERAKRAATELGDKVIFQEIDTIEREKLLEWGILDGLFIDDHQVRTGPPPSYEKIKKKIIKRLKKLDKLK
ncbi:MAG: GNAT family N-acetyltransferase [Candidatus Hodarchaeota archaeon]